MKRLTQQSNSGQRPLLLLPLLLIPLLIIWLLLRQETAATDQGFQYVVNFISSAEAHADEQQYQNGTATGADWNRPPFDWFFTFYPIGGRPVILIKTDY